MFQFFKNNRYFFSWLFLFMVVGGWLLIVQDKSDAILFFSERRSTAADLFFKSSTRLGEEIAYVVAGLIMLAVRFRYVLMVASTGGTVLLTSFLLKKLFAEDRPFTYFQLSGIADQINFVEGVDLHTGASSFPSGHSMGAFALYALLAFLLPKSKLWATFFFLLALSVAISRVYLVQHFWQDAYTGSLVGVAIAMLIFATYRRIEEHPDHWIDKPVFFGKRFMSQLRQ